MKLASFDLEISKAVTGHDLKSQRPLGISCAAIQVNKVCGFYYDQASQASKLSKDGCREIVRDLTRLVDDGYTIITVNGAGFDFDILAEESGQKQKCAYLAMNHCDLSLITLCHRGVTVDLQAFLDGFGVKRTFHNVTLKDGSTSNDQTGEVASELWENVVLDYSNDLDYLRDSARYTLEVAVTAVNMGVLRWVSKKGYPYQMSLPSGSRGHYLPTAKECFRYPLPDTSWMDNPVRREDLIKWMK